MTSKVDQLISYGLGELGKPYVYGAEGPNTFDCSGLMQFIAAKVGINLPRTADAQYHATSRVGSPAAGDLVFWIDNSTGRADHVALYLGAGKVLSAPHTGAVVHTSTIFNEDGHTRAYGRISGLGTTVSAITTPVGDTINAGASLAGGALDSILGGARQIVLEGAGGVLGLALVGLGLYMLVRPKIQAKKQEVEALL